MSDFPTNIPLPLFVHTWTRWGAAYELGKTAALGGGAMVSITWPSANMGVYVPVWIPWSYPVRRVFWINGSAVTATSMCFGIYTADGTLIYSTGSTAESGASATQYTTPSPDFVLAPGRYYFALSCTTTTANCGGQGAVGMTLPRTRLAGLLQQASVATLPATMTPVVVANACIPICGVTRTSSGY